jgi:hypothetical protein
MAQSTYTPIQLYYSTTAAATPSAGNLVDGELAINTNDGKLFYKDSGGSVQTIAYKNVPLSTVTGTLAVANGGTGTATAFTSGSIVFAGASGVYSQDNANLFWDNSNDRLGVGTSAPGFKIDVSGSGTTAKINTLDTHDGGSALSTWLKVGRRSGTGANAYVNTLHDGSDAVSALTFAFGTTGTGTEVLRLTSTGYTQPVAYADTVVALGNSGTATTITCTSGNVFTATLTGNCTFTLSAPIATGSSSFTLILTNDGTAGRTVAWAGGSFVFPGGAGSLSRTTTANAVDVWVFFTPNGGTTWYGNIAMKDVKA